MIILNGLDLNFLEFQVFSACTPNPANSIETGVSPRSFGCLPNSYEETVVLNPPYAARSYSSIFVNTFVNSALDDLFNAMAWIPTANTAGE